MGSPKLFSTTKAHVTRGKSVSGHGKDLDLGPNGASGCPSHVTSQDYSPWLGTTSRKSRSVGWLINRPGPECYDP